MRVTEAAKECGLKQGELSNLLFQGVIVPESFSLIGSRKTAILGKRNLREIGIIKSLRKNGVKYGYIKGILDLLRKSKQEWWSGKSYIVIEDGDSYYVTDNPAEPKNVTRILLNRTTVIIQI